MSHSQCGALDLDFAVDTTPTGCLGWAGVSPTGHRALKAAARLDSLRAKGYSQHGSPVLWPPPPSPPGPWFSPSLMT